MQPPAGWRMLVHGQLASTSDLVRTLAEAGEPEGLAVLARRQTAGRGTQGRRWESPAGNLHLTVLLRPAAWAREMPQWALLAGLALHEALAAHVAAPGRLTLKWPNDILLDGAKCAGLLCEAAIDSGGMLESLAIGFGANLVAAPRIPGRRTAALPPPAPAAEDVAVQLLRSLDRWRRVHALEGFPPVRQAWLERGHARGTPLSVTSPGGALDGLFEGLDEGGALLLRTGDGLHTVRVGEVAA